MTNKEIKLDMIDALYNRGEWIKKVNDVEYRTRCPYCGDSKKSMYTGHLYININPDDNYPMVWNCFRCNESGVVNKDFLSMMDINDLNLKSSITSLNKTSDKIKARDFYNGTKLIINDFTIPEIFTKDQKIKYVEDRLGVDLSLDDIKDLKIVVSLQDYLKENKIDYVTLSPNVCRMLENKYVGFVSYGSSYILFRDISDSEVYHWIKYPLTKESRESKCFYSISQSIDLFTDDIITINLAEGVLDILSCYSNLGYNDSNTLNIAVCGKRYDSIINYLIESGFIGNNIHVNIFADNDKDFNKKASNPTTVEYFKKVFYKYKHLFGKVHVYYNLKYKDIGVPKDKIALRKIKL